MLRLSMRGYRQLLTTGRCFVILAFNHAPDALVSLASYSLHSFPCHQDCTRKHCGFFILRLAAQAGPASAAGAAGGTAQKLHLGYSLTGNPLACNYYSAYMALRRTNPQPL